ncbi:hypothetical protein ACFV30_01255 [Streptomyces sp. NPDC059752]|uniref:hypothetical protein n=2 Tax=unclassified Streptomyces TaxID=2593676 RepID=UPI003657E198
MTTHPPSAELVMLVRSYVMEDNFHRAGALVRAHPELLREPAARVLRQLAKKGPRGGRLLAEQHVRFLSRCRAEPQAVFTPGSPIIDPTCYALVADRHEQAEEGEARFEEATSPAALAACAAQWTSAWGKVIGEPRLQAAHPALLASLLNDAARAHLQCFFAIGRIQHLQQACSWFELAVALTSEASPQAPTRRSNLGLALSELAECPSTPDPADCRARALRLLRDAARSAAVGTPSWADCQIRLALGRLRSYWATERVSQLDAAVRDLTAVWEMGAASVDAAHTLGCVLRQRYAARGHAEDLDMAVALLSTARDATPPGAPQRLRQLLDLGVALLDRHLRDAVDADLEEAGEALQAAVTAAPETSPDRPAAVAHYAGYWYRRFEATGSMSALATALDLARDAAQSPAARTGERAAWLVNQAVITEETARQSADPGLFDEALTAFAKALGVDPPAAVRRSALAGMGTAWRDRFACSQEPGDLDQAIRRLEEAHAEIQPRSPDASRIGLSLALARFERYALADRTWTRSPTGAGAMTTDSATTESRDPADLLASLTAVRALARRRTPRLDRHRIRAALLILTLAAAEAHLISVSMPALRRAVRQTWADAARIDPEMLLWTGALWGRWASAELRWRDAALGYRIAVDTLHELARRQADPQHGARWLRSGGQLAGEAAFASAAAGRPQEAVRLMETGRLVLVTEALVLKGVQLGHAPAGLPPQLLDRIEGAVRRLRAAERAAQNQVRAL